MSKNIILLILAVFVVIMLYIFLGPRGPKVDATVAGSTMTVNVSNVKGRSTLVTVDEVGTTTTTVHTSTVTADSTISITLPAQGAGFVKYVVQVLSSSGADVKNV